MSLIAKIDPPLTVSDDGVAEIHARPYQKPVLSDGAEVFIWTSETSGGHGLAARGHVLASRIERFANKNGEGTHSELVLHLKITDGAPKRALSLDQIAEHRDSRSTTPAGAIGRVLYKHALNKITSIEAATADFVRSHFEEE